MYPGYRRHHVLNEYAVTFFALLNEGYRIRYEDAILQGHLNDLPSMSPTDRHAVYRELEWVSKHPGDILNPDEQGDDPGKIKKLLG